MKASAPAGASSSAAARRCRRPWSSGTTARASCSSCTSPAAQARFAYRIVEADARSTDAELSLSYTLRGGALGQAVDALLLRAAMQKQVEAVASAMKLFYETEA